MSIYYKVFRFEVKCDNCEAQATKKLVRMTSDYPSSIIQTMQLCDEHFKEYASETVDKEL